MAVLAALSILSEHKMG